MRYEVRRYNLEEQFLQDGGMVYLPCQSLEHAIEEYRNEIETYSDNWHEVELCKVDYTEYGERVKVLASTRNIDPFAMNIKNGL